MNSLEPDLFAPDPAAIFACANSLWEACRGEAERNPSIDLSADYSGWDQLMREVMRIGTLFENWSCENIDFEELDEVWAYYLGDEFGKACLSVLFVSDLAQFRKFDCLRVAFRLKLPVRVRVDLPVALDFEARNPRSGSAFAAFKIQAVRLTKESANIVPFIGNDDPFDEKFGFPFFGFYGLLEDGLREHIADRPTIDEALTLAKNLVPGIAFEELSQTTAHQMNRDH